MLGFREHAQFRDKRWRARRKAAARLAEFRLERGLTLTAGATSKLLQGHQEKSRQLAALGGKLPAPWRPATSPAQA